VEHGAPDIKVGTELLTVATRFFGAANVTWRFSPIPLVPDIYDRFEFILKRAARVGVRQVFVSFMQPNDRLIDTRDPKVRLRTLKYMGFISKKHNVTVRLCQDDASLLDGVKPMAGLTLGVCAPPENFERLQLVEKCGCAKAVDPFSLNEACGFACEYCYTNDKQVSTKKRNTTHLPVIL
jgi:sulfatase maturation enzyme AslB (radical SAM superfamily)